MAISYLGTTTYEQSAPERWGVNSDGFDTLSVPMHGSRTALSTYLATLARWDASLIDANMFLAGWDNDDHKQYPTVTLKYIGCRGGIVPAAKTKKGSGLGSISKSFLDNDYNNIPYLAPNETTTWISTSAPTRPTAGITYPGPTAVNFGISLQRWYVQDQEPIWFFGLCNVREETSDFQSEEVVPGHYWQNSSTKTWALI